MGSIFYIERNGRKYAYESTSRRVPGRKNPVTDKVYLGRVDPESGKIIPKESRSMPAEIHAKDYGNVALLDHIQSELDILEDLKECFQGLSGNIMGAAMSQVIDATSFDDIHYVVDGSIIREKLKLRGSLSPAAMSKLSEDVGSSMNSMDMFFARRVKRTSGKFYSLDLTSVSSYSDMGGWSEWGHNRDEENLRQTNIAMVTDENGMPVMFRMLPGSVADIAVMESTISDLKEMGCSGRFIMDRGFESAANVRALLESGAEFTMPSNVKTEPVKKLMSRAIADMKDSSAFRYHERRPYKCVEYELGVISKEDGCEYVIEVPKSQKGSAENNRLFGESLKLKAFVVYDPRKAAEDIDAVMSMINDIELKYENTRHSDVDGLYAKQPAFIRRYLEFTGDGDGMMHVRRKQNALSFADNRAGMFVMLSSPDTTWEQMMSSYDVRDWVEKAFDVYKNDIDGRRSRTGDPDRARGRLFIKFVALMMRIRMQNVLRDHNIEVLETKAKKDSVNGKTVDEVIRTLNTLMAVGCNGDWKLTAVSKGVREIYEVFGMEVPKTGQIIIG